jgi:glycosyltransferase involved in cell wall biosynthesis
MRIALISRWFSEAMGYGENCLPKALAFLGVEVHLITANVQPYFNSPNYQETYEPFIGPGVVDCGVKSIDGYTLHRLPHVMHGRGLRIHGLPGALRELRPDVVQTFEAGGWTTYDAALAARRMGCRLFLEMHHHASVYPGSSWRARAHGLWQQMIVAPIAGRWVNRVTEKCYPISLDAAEIAVRYFGIQRQKICVTSLGVDTELFKPVGDDTMRQRRNEMRRRLGFQPSEIVCIYTGRFSPSKDPLCLAQAIAALTERGQPFRGLFIGSGAAEKVAAIRGCRGCVVHPFVPFSDLPAYYQAADVGVWPRQESTSQLDAAASGLPIIVSDRVAVIERVAGNGLAYREGDCENLVSALLTLSDAQRRSQMGAMGAAKMRQQFSWQLIAQRRLEDYRAALENHD